MRISYKNEFPLQLFGGAGNEGKKVWGDVNFFTGSSSEHVSLKVVHVNVFRF